MRYWTLAVATTVAVALPATAEARSSAMVKHYKHDYHAVASKFGKRAPGRNIVRWGLSNGHRASKGDVRRSIGVLERMLHPAPVVHTVAPSVTHTSTYRAPAPAPAAPAPAPAPAAPAPAPAPAPAASAPTTSSGGWAIPSYIVQCESGGNWGAVNPSSGAGGAYQIMPGTWRAYGGSGLPQNASPGQQSAIARKIWNSAGPSAWQCAH